MFVAPQFSIALQFFVYRKSESKSPHPEISLKVFCVFRGHCTTSPYLGNRPSSPYSTSKQQSAGEDEDDTPVRYSTSAARQWQARTSRTGPEMNRLWYEPYVILGSITIFMIYFTMLREENDVDEELSRSLYSRIEGLEEYQLRLSLDYNKKHNRDNTDIIKRLKELEAEKEKSLES